MFLATPRPYLGEDVCATMRLWLEEGEKPATPLAAKIFSSAGQATKVALPKSLLFTYRLTSSAAPGHLIPNADRLNDGMIGEVGKDSVRVDGDAIVTVDLGRMPTSRKPVWPYFTKMASTRRRT